MFVPTTTLDTFVRLARRHSHAKTRAQTWGQHHHIACNQHCSERDASGGPAGFVEFSEAPWT